MPPLGGPGRSFLAHFPKNAKTLDFEYLPSGNHGFVGSGGAFLELSRPKFHPKNAIGTTSAQKATKININRLRSAPGRLPGRKKKTLEFPKRPPGKFLGHFLSLSKTNPTPRGRVPACSAPAFRLPFLEYRCWRLGGVQKSRSPGFQGPLLGLGGEAKASPTSKLVV